MARWGWLARFRLVGLSVLAFVLAHDLVFLATYRGSYAEMLARTGHGDSWTVSAVIVATIGGAILAAAALRLLHLNRQARLLGCTPATVSSPGRRFVMRCAATILLLALAIFVAVENLERLTAGLPAPGLNVLGSSGYIGTMPIFALIAAGLALVDALYRWRRDVLVRQIATARSRFARVRQVTPRPRHPWPERRPGGVLGHRLAGRSPPRPACT
jgi:hypothetical protein